MIRQKLTTIRENLGDDIKFIKLISFLIFLVYFIKIFFYDIKLYYDLLIFIRAIITFIFIVFSLYIYERTRYTGIIFLGISLGIVAIYDILSVAFTGGIDSLILYNEDTAIKLWTIARFVESISFFMLSIKVPKTIRLKSVFLIYLSVFLLSVHLILNTDILPYLWIEYSGYTRFITFIKYIVLGLNLFTLSYHILKTKVIGIKENKFLIFVILLTLIFDMKFRGITYQRSLMNFIILSTKFISYYLIFDFIKKGVFKSDYDRKIANLNKKDILEYALKSSLEGTIIIGMDNRILYSNDIFNHILDYKKNIKNLKYSKVIEILVKNVKNPETLRRQILDPLGTGKDNEANIFFKNGEVYKIRSFEFSIEGESIGRIISFLNITESYKLKKLKERLEEEKDKIANLKELDSLKTEFVGRVTHDFRTPITIIMSTIELWDMRYEKTGNYGDYNFTKANFRTIKQNCLRVLKLTNNLIDLTKISREYMELKLSNYNIISLVEDITMSVSNYAKREEINLIFDTNTEEKIIRCHSDSIERIILNLLSNAIKFTPKGGEIKVSIEDKEDLVIISIKDSGVGIPKEMHKSIFGPFKQVGGFTKREKEGSGIGLSLVKFLVEEHGGKIYINDKYYSGTEFIIELPTNKISNDKNIMNYDLDMRRLSVELSDI